MAQFLSANQRQAKSKLSKLSANGNEVRGYIYSIATISFVPLRNKKGDFTTSVGCIQRNSKVKFFFKNTQNCFAYISVTKYRSEVVLYSKRSAGYPLSPHIKAIFVAFLPAE